MTTSLVRYGSLTLPLAAKQFVDGAFAYLSRDAVERALIRRVEQSPERHRIVINHRGDDSYRPDTRTIRWDPTSAMRTTHGGRQSPALDLAHELDHAAQSDRRYRHLTAVRVPAYDTIEERRVITGTERHAARTLHESTRSDHRGFVYRVTGPTER
jgi:hypothetical protein